MKKNDFSTCFTMQVLGSLPPHCILCSHLIEFTRESQCFLHCADDRGLFPQRGKWGNGANEHIIKNFALFCFVFPAKKTFYKRAKRWKGNNRTHSLSQQPTTPPFHFSCHHPASIWLPFKTLSSLHKPVFHKLLLSKQKKTTIWQQWLPHSIPLSCCSPCPSPRIRLIYLPLTAMTVSSKLWLLTPPQWVWPNHQVRPQQCPKQRPRRRVSPRGRARIMESEGTLKGSLPAFPFATSEDDEPPVSLSACLPVQMTHSWGDLKDLAPVTSRPPASSSSQLPWDCIIWHPV